MHTGATVRFIDIQKDSFEIDYDKLYDLINDKTKVIIAVDYAGIIADYEKIYKVVENKKNVFNPAQGNNLGSRVQQSKDRVLVFSDSAHALFS